MDSTVFIHDKLPKTFDILLPRNCKAGLVTLLISELVLMHHPVLNPFVCIYLGFVLAIQLRLGSESVLL